jgi:hypothetical protein
VLVEAVRGDKKKEAYEYEVRIRRKDKIDESRRCIVSGLAPGVRRERRREERKKREKR